MADERRFADVESLRPAVRAAFGRGPLAAMAAVQARPWAGAASAKFA